MGKPTPTPSVGNVLNPDPQMPPGIDKLPGASLLDGLTPWRLVLGMAALFLPLLIVWALMTTIAWWLGWEGRRLRNHAIAAWSLPLLTMLWHGDWVAPFAAYAETLRFAFHGELTPAVVDTLPLAIPLGMTLAAWNWSRYRARLATGRGIGDPVKAERVLRRHLRHKGRTARRLVEYTTPLVDARGDLVLGPLTEHGTAVPRGAVDELHARHRRFLTVPRLATRQHVVLVADPGSGKTTLILRWCVAAMQAEWDLYAAGQTGRPLMLFIDCKGGTDGRDTGFLFEDLMTRLGLAPERVGMWPYDARLDLWGMSPRDMVATLHALIGTSHEHYDELRLALVHLAVEAPTGPPTTSLEFLERLNEKWLRAAWQGHTIEQQQIAAVCGGREPAILDATVKYANLFRTLGRSLDSGRQLNDFDALYCTVPGTARQSEARAQVAALIKLLEQLVANGEHGRAVILVVDEYSAVAEKGGVGLVNVFERMRSQGVGALAAAQSWEGLGWDDDERTKLVSAAAGGVLLGRSKNPDDLCGMLGTTRRAEPSQHTVGGKYGDEGSVRVQDTFLVAPQRIREMEPGEVVYAKGGNAWWGRVVPVDLAKLQPAKEIQEETTERRLPFVKPRVPVAELEYVQKQTIEDQLRGGEL